MEELFINLLDMSITAGWIILVIALLRFCLKKAPRWITCALWAVPALRLVFPFSIPSSISAFQILPGAQTITSDILYAQTPTITSQVPPLDEAINSSLTASLAPKLGDSANPMQVVMFIASILWLCGVCAILLYSLISYIRLKHRVASATLLRENIYQTEAATTPFLMGIIHPRIYLPYQITSEQMENVLAHEWGHLARRDHIWKPIAFVIACIHWFNPLVWLAYWLFCRDMELACDERVVSDYDVYERKEYSQTLLALAAKKRRIGACPLAFGEVSIKERIQKALSYQKPALWIILVALVLCVILAVCLLTDPAATLQDHAHFSIRIATDQPIYSASYRSDNAASSCETNGPAFEKGSNIFLEVREEGPTDYTLSAYGKDGKLVASASFSDDLTPNGQLDFILLDDSLVRADEIATDASYNISQSIADGTVIHSITNASGALKQATQNCVLQHYASSSIVVNPDPVPNDMYYQITIHDSSENQSVYQVFLYGGDVIVKEKDGISSIIPRQVYDNFNELFLESTR